MITRGFEALTVQFMAAYQAGLTGKVAKWAVRKQKLHRRVSTQAMMSVAALVNVN